MYTILAGNNPAKIFQTFFWNINTPCKSRNTDGDDAKNVPDTIHTRDISTPFKTECTSFVKKIIIKEVSSLAQKNITIYM